MLTLGARAVLTLGKARTLTLGKARTLALGKARTLTLGKARLSAESVRRRVARCLKDDRPPQIVLTRTICNEAPRGGPTRCDIEPVITGSMSHRVAFAGRGGT
jgi:hypothetical protein